MDICFVTNDSVEVVSSERLAALKDSQVVVFGFNGLGLVSYKKELSGETEYFRDVAELSSQLSAVVISGCDTDTYGVFRHSAVVAEKGKILGVTDMAHSIDDSEFVAGGNFRVYDTSAGKIGVLISEDLFFPESPRILALCDADIIICLFKKLEGAMPQVTLRASAFSNGVSMALCAKNYASVADVKGNVVMSGGGNIVKTKIKTEKDFHLISLRQRGLYREFSSGY